MITTEIVSKLNSRIVIRHKFSGATYSGMLSGFKHKENKLCLTNLYIVTKYHTIIHSKRNENNVRWFKAQKFNILGENDVKDLDKSIADVYS